MIPINLKDGTRANKITQGVIQKPLNQVNCQKKIKFQNDDNSLINNSGNLELGIY